MRLLWTSLSLSLGLAYAQTVSFLPPTVAINSPNVVASCSGCIAVADFNGDGKPDIAFDFTRTLPLAGVVLGNGDGTFGPILPISLNQTFDGPFFTGDFNGDGKTDLIGGSSLFLGTGNGTFSAPVALSSCVDFGRGSESRRQDRSDLRDNGSSQQGRRHLPQRRHGGIAGDGKRSSCGGFQRRRHPGRDDPPNLGLVRDRPRARRWNLRCRTPDPLPGGFGSPLQLVLSRRPSTGTEKPISPRFLITVSLSTCCPETATALSVTLIQNEISYPGSFTAAADFNQRRQTRHPRRQPDLPRQRRRAPSVSRSLSAPSPADAWASPCDLGLNSTVIADFNGDGFPDVAAYTYLDSGALITTLLNDSPGNGFTTPGISSATGMWPVGPGSIVSAFGTNLSQFTDVATTNPAPTTLGGIRPPRP